MLLKNRADIDAVDEVSKVACVRWNNIFSYGVQYLWKKLYCWMYFKYWERVVQNTNKWFGLTNLCMVN